MVKEPSDNSRVCRYVRLLDVGRRPLGREFFNSRTNKVASARVISKCVNQTFIPVDGYSFLTWRVAAVCGKPCRCNRRGLLFPPTNGPVETRDERLLMGPQGRGDALTKMGEWWKLRSGVVSVRRESARLCF